MNLKRLIASSCRQKILETLSRIEQTHVTDLVRRVNSTYNQVNRNLQILEKEGLIRTRFYGRLRVIQLNRESPRTEAALKALRILKNVELKESAHVREQKSEGK